MVCCSCDFLNYIATRAQDPRRVVLAPRQTHALPVCSSMPKRARDEVVITEVSSDEEGIGSVATLMTWVGRVVMMSSRVSKRSVPDVPMKVLRISQGRRFGHAQLEYTHDGQAKIFTDKSPKDEELSNRYTEVAEAVHLDLDRFLNDWSPNIPAQMPMPAGLPLDLVLPAFQMQCTERTIHLESVVAPMEEARAAISAALA